MRWPALALVILIPAVAAVVAALWFPERLASPVYAVASCSAGGLVAWLAIVSGAAQLARRSRALLLALFLPGLYASALVAIALILVNAALVLVPLAAFAVALEKMTSRVPVGIFFAVGLGALVGAFNVARSSFVAIRRVTHDVFGRPVTERDAPGLWALVREAAKAVGTAPADQILVGLEPNFFVTDAPVRTLAGTCQGRTLFVSLSLARVMSVAELRAVIGHELAHWAGGDVRFSRGFYPVYRGTSEAIAALTAQVTANGGVALWPALVSLEFFLWSFASAEAEIGRARELAADAVGARLSGNQAAAAALTKAHVYGDLFGGVVREAEVAARTGAVPRVAGRFAEVCAKAAAKLGRASLHPYRSRNLYHPTDSHPPLAIRLEALGLPLEGLAREVAQVQPAQPAATLFASADDLDALLGRALLVRGGKPRDAASAA